MEIDFMPKTLLGRWSVGLIIAFFLLFAMLRLLVVSGQRGGEIFFSNLFLAVPGLFMAASGVGAFLTGIISIIKSKERSVLVFSAAAIGLFVLIFCLGEVLSSH